jgi:hypothetical protein
MAITHLVAINISHFLIINEFMYTYTWKKYLPVIRLLLKRSAAADQTIALNRIDFEKGNRVRKPVVSFSLDMVNGRLTVLNPPVAAKDMLEILMQDDIARSLIRQNHYAISLGSDLKLTIKNLTPVVDEKDVPLTEDVNEAQEIKEEEAPVQDTKPGSKNKKQTVS